MFLSSFFSTPKPAFHKTFYGIESRVEEWNFRYKTLDIEKEQKERLAETEYVAVIETQLEKLRKEKDGPIKCLELAAGSGPWTRYLKDKGYDVDYSDYSEVIVERAEKEQGFTSFVADISKLETLPAGKYDLIIMAGAIYENSDPFFVSKVYPGIAHILSENGIFIQFLNRYLNTSNFLSMSKFNFKCFFSPINWNLLRRLIGKKRVETSILFWLLPLNMVSIFAKASGLTEIARKPMQQEVGLSELLPFVPIYKNKSIMIQETAFPMRKEIFKSWFLKISENLREDNSANISRCAGLVFQKLKAH